MGTLNKKLSGNPVLTALVNMGAASAPLLGAVAASATSMSVATFKEICTTFLHYVSKAGVVKDVRAGEPSGLSPVKIDVALVFWGSVVHSAVSVPVKTSELASDLLLQGRTPPTNTLKVDSFVSFH